MTPTRLAIEGLRAALRQIYEHAGGDGETRWESWDADDTAFVQELAGAALLSWEGREPLRDDEEMIRIISVAMVGYNGSFSERVEAKRIALDAIDRTLLGSTKGDETPR